MIQSQEYADWIIGSIPAGKKFSADPAKGDRFSLERLKTFDRAMDSSPDQKKSLLCVHCVLSGKNVSWRLLRLALDHPRLS